MLFRSHQAALAHLADELANTDQNSVAEVIHKLLSDTDFSHLYSINQQPVVLDWQSALQAETMQLQAIAPSAADSAAVVMAASAAKSVRTSSAVKREKRWLWWLLVLPLLTLACVVWTLSPY